MPARADPYRNLNFVVDLGTGQPLGMLEVILPIGTVDVIEYREGGEANLVRKLPGLTRYTNLVLKRGITQSRELYDWWRRVRDGQTQRRDVIVALLDESRAEVRRWVMRDAWPVRYHVSTLEATGREVVVETLEIAVEDVELV